MGWAVGWQPGSRLPEIDLGIVADIEAPGFALYFGITAYQGMGEDDIVEVGKRPDDGIFEDGIVDAGLFADGNVWTDDGVADVAAGCDTDGLNDDGIFELVFRSDRPAELLEEFGIGFQEGFFFTAVEPILDLEGSKFYVAADHAFDGVGEVVFAITGDVVANIGFQAIEKNAGLADAVYADQSHIGFGDLGLLDYPFDAAVVFEFGHPEVAGVIHSFHAKQGMGLAEYVLYVVFADGVAQNNKDLIFPDDVPGQQYGVAYALTFVLIDEMSRQLRVFLFDEVLDLLTKIAYDKDELGDTGFHQLVDDDGEDGLTR